MATSLISWEQVVRACPKETAAVAALLHKYDIGLNDFFRGIIGDKDWHDVVDLRDCHMDITEMDEAKLEDSIINDLQAHWDALTASFEAATEKEGLCYRVSEIVFENENEHNETPLLAVELAPVSRGDSPN
jgi:hypothetical protein